MTIENNTEQTTVTVGQLLVQARERMGLTQDIVAERLCLKVSTVNEIEQDIPPLAWNLHFYAVIFVYTHVWWVWLKAKLKT